MEIIWKMTEDNWNDYKKTESHDYPLCGDVFGNVIVGGICCDLQHTLDESDWYPFANLFYIKDGCGYGALEDGTEYDLHDDAPRIPIECDTFKEFKEKFSGLLEDYIEQYDELMELINVEAKW